PEEAERIDFTICRDEDRQDVEAALGRSGARQYPPEQGHAQRRDERLQEPQADGDPEEREPALGRTHGRHRLGLGIHRLRSSSVWRVGTLPTAAARPALGWK